jgi:hypothetical protein
LKFDDKLAQAQCLYPEQFSTVLQESFSLLLPNSFGERTVYRQDLKSEACLPPGFLL